MARISIYLLGRFRVELDGEPVTAFKSNKVRALLAYLAVESSRPHTREALAGLLWPEVPDEMALADLRDALSNLRLLLHDRDSSSPFIRVEQGALQFDAERDVWLDVAAFVSLTSGALEPDRLEKAISLYRGSFLDGFGLEDSYAFEEWLLLRREELNRQMGVTLRRLADVSEARSDYLRAESLVHRWIELDAYDEEAHRQLMRVLALGGKRNAALAHFEAVRRLLAAELGVEPELETTALYRRVRDGETGSPQPSSPAPGPAPGSLKRGFDVAEAAGVPDAAAGAIPALVPQGSGHQFVCYADSCSGVPGAPHGATLSAVNAVVARLSPPPEFICFPGDEIRGFTADDEALRDQWRYWFDQEMGWLDRQAIPLYHTTGNHTTYDAASEAVFRQMLAHLPRNGPPGQEGLSYLVRHGDLLLIFANTNWSGLGGEGRVETAWLEQTLAQHAHARHKLVLGHHPVYAVNGFAGAYQRQLAPDDGRRFWRVLVRHGVLAYICSHILAFDVQVHDGVLQITTAGAGTADLMPAGIEYHHCLQAAIGAGGLRYQVLDTAGQVREWLAWPLTLPPAVTWAALALGDQPAPVRGGAAGTGQARLVAWHLSGICPPPGDGQPQTLLSGWDKGPDWAPLWIGLLGRENRLGVLLSPAPGRSPHLWHGPELEPGQPFDLQLAIHTGMGPGGLLWRRDDGEPWSSLAAASPWGAERLTWPDRWSVGLGQRGPDDRPFRGLQFRVAWHTQVLEMIQDRTIP